MTSNSEASGVDSRTVQAAFDGLSDVQRALLKAVRTPGMTVERLAAESGMSPGDVRATLRSGLLDFSRGCVPANGGAAPEGALAPAIS